MSGGKNTPERCFTYFRVLQLTRKIPFFAVANRCDPNTGETDSRAPERAASLPVADYRLPVLGGLRRVRFGAGMCYAGAARCDAANGSAADGRLELPGAVYAKRLPPGSVPQEAVGRCDTFRQNTPRGDTHPPARREWSVSLWNTCDTSRMIPAGGTLLPPTGTEAGGGISRKSAAADFFSASEIRSVTARDRQPEDPAVKI